MGSLRSENNLAKGAKGLNEIIEKELRIVSFNPRNLFTDLGLEVYLSNLANAEYTILSLKFQKLLIILTNLFKHN